MQYIFLTALPPPTSLYRPVHCCTVASAVNLNHKTYEKLTGNSNVHKGTLRYIIYIYGHTEPQIFDFQVQVYIFKYFIIQTQKEAAALRGGGLSVLLCATMRSLPSLYSSKNQTTLCPKVILVISSSNQREL